MVSTKDVLDHHLKSFGEGDLKGILSDYAPAAVLFTPDGPLSGRSAASGSYVQAGRSQAEERAGNTLPLLSLCNEGRS